MVSSHECEMMWVALYFKPYDNERHPILWSLAVSPSTCRTWGVIWHNGMRTRQLCGRVWASTLLGNQGADSHMFLSVLFSARIFKHRRQHTQMLECRHRFLRAGICMPGCGHRFPRAGIQMLECGHRAGHYLLIICNAGTHTPFGVYINISQKGWGGEGGE